MIPSELWTSAKNALEAYRIGKHKKLYVNVLGKINGDSGAELPEELLPDMETLQGPNYKPLDSAHSLLLAADKAINKKLEFFFDMLDNQYTREDRQTYFWLAIGWGATQEALRQTRLYVESEKILESELQ